MSEVSKSSIRHSQEEIDRLEGCLDILEEARRGMMEADFESDAYFEHRFRLGDLRNLLGTLGYDLVEGPVLQTPFVRIDGSLYDIEEFAKKLIEERSAISKTLAR